MLEEFQAAAPRCAENEVSEEDYIVSYRAVPRPGWRFAGWSGGTGCDPDSKPPFCEYNVAQGFVELTDATWPGTTFPPTTAVFAELESVNAWTEGSNMPTGAGAISSCSVDNHIYVFGIGWRGVGGARGAAKYDVSLDRWSTLPDMPDRQGWATTSAVSGKCYVIGGASRFGGDALTTVNEFDPGSGSWRPRASLPKSRTLAAAVVVDEKIYVIGGGASDSFTPAHRSDTAIYDPARDEWTTGSGMPASRVLLAAGVIDGYIYAVGGMDTQAGITDTVQRYDPSSDTWTVGAPLPSAKMGHKVSVLERGLHVIGGAGSGRILSGSVERYDSDADRWISRAPLNAARWAHGSEVVDGRILAFGGFASATNFSAPPRPSTETYAP